MTFSTKRQLCTFLQENAIEHDKKYHYTLSSFRMLHKEKEKVCAHIQYVVFLHFGADYLVVMLYRLHHEPQMSVPGTSFSGAK